MGLFGFLSKKKRVVIFDSFAGMSLMRLNVGRKAEDMASATVRLGEVTDAEGFILTLDNRPIPTVDPNSSGGDLFVYKDPDAAKVIADEIKVKSPDAGSRIEIKDLVGFADELETVQENLIRIAKQQIHDSYATKAPVVKGPLSEHSLLDLNRVACENLGIRTSTFDWRDDRIPDWMDHELDKAWKKNSLDFDFSQKKIAYSG